MSRLRARESPNARVRFTVCVYACVCDATYMHFRAANVKRIAELEGELARHAAAGELKLRSLRQEHERVKSGLQMQLEMRSAGVAADAGADAGTVAAGGGGGAGPRKEAAAARDGGGRRDLQQQQQEQQQEAEVCVCVSCVNRRRA